MSNSFSRIIAKKIGRFSGRFIGSPMRKRYERIIRQINSTDNTGLDLDTFMGYKIISGFAAGMAAAVLLNEIYYLIPGFLFSCFAGFFIPDLFLVRLLKRSQEEFESDLPYTIDLLYIATLSGQNIFNSIKILTEKYRGSISNELSRFLKEINFGIGRSQAYMNALNRNKTESFRNLLFLLVQAEKFGSKISELLKQKSDNLRFELAQRCEIRSRRVSILLLFPLVFLILPAFVLLVGGPLVFSIAGSFLSG